jgi:putative hydrolase of the HAD superfamily
MKTKAVLFDLFETLITEWGHEKYTKRAMCSDLGVDKSLFDIYWEEKEQDRYLGIIDFESSILYACEKLGISIDRTILQNVIDKRTKTKSACFDHIQPSVLQLLGTLNDMGLKTAIVSNCSAEEVSVIRESGLSQYFDEIVLSYEVHMKKPDVCIYEEAAKRLGVSADECIFIGDGGSNELEGACDAGMTAIQAKWYTNQFPQKRDSKEGLIAAEEPLEILSYIGK